MSSEIKSSHIKFKDCFVPISMTIFQKSDNDEHRIYAKCDEFVGRSRAYKTKGERDRAWIELGNKIGVIDMSWDE